MHTELDSCKQSCAVFSVNSVTHCLDLNLNDQKTRHYFWEWFRIWKINENENWKKVVGLQIIAKDQVHEAGSSFLHRTNHWYIRVSSSWETFAGPGLKVAEKKNLPHFTVSWGQRWDIWAANSNFLKIILLAWLQLGNVVVRILKILNFLLCFGLGRIAFISRLRF